MGSELAAPAVVVVIVTCDPGPWLDESLSSLAAQDYTNFSVLVLDAGTEEGLADRVATALPGARVARAPGAHNFAEAANEAMARVDGAPHVLICHDDVALAADALRLLVEEAYRSNGGLTCPKFVRWDAPDRLLSVGLGADRLGVTHPLVEPGELDQGQHDAAREIFVAPSGAVLVRTDLWTALGGFNLALGAPGEDLDLSWRAQLAGARVVVAPQAHARHLLAGEKGLRLPTSPSQRSQDWEARREANRLRTLWTCYSAWLLAVMVPVTVFFALVEVVWGLAHHKKASGALLPLRAIGASLRQPGPLWQARRQAQGMRRASDLAIWKSQSRGSARLRALVRKRLERGHQLAWAASRATLAHEPREPHEVGQLPNGARSSPVHRGSQPNWRATLTMAAVVLVVLLIGYRHILSQQLPLVGQMPSTAGGTGAWWRAWWSGTGPGGLGSGGANLPGMLLMGLLGLVSGGSASLALHLLVIGPLLVGTLGIYVEAKPFCSQRGRLAATLVYAALPLPYNALAQGHLPGLVAYAASPWLIGQLCCLSAQAPYAHVPGAHVPGAHVPDAQVPGAHVPDDGPGWRGLWPKFVALGLFLGAVSSLAPQLLLLVLVIGAALAGGALLTGSGRQAGKLLAVSVVTVAAALVSLLPWSVRLLSSWKALTGSPTTGPQISVAALLRFHTGPFGGGVLAWAVVGAGAVCLLIGRSWRLEWGARLWAVALVFFVLAWAAARGWFSGPELEVLLAPAGAALALATALGGAAVEHDLPGHRFGWRQFAPAFGALAVVAVCVPAVGWSGNGQWDLPASGAEVAFVFPAPSQSGDYRVLWAGPSAALPLAAQGHDGDLAFATSSDGVPPATQLWASTGPGAGPLVSRDLDWAVTGRTTGLGQLLGPLSVRYVVVPVGHVDAVAGVAGQAAAQQLVQALSRQVDLVPVGTEPGYQVFANSAWVPLFCVLGQDGRALEPVVLGSQGRATGTLTARAGGGRLYAAVPFGTWSASLDGHRLAQERAFGWASSWQLPTASSGASPAAQVVLSPAGRTAHHIEDVVMLALWAVGLGLALTGLRSRWRAQLTTASLELGSPAAEVSEIDWTAALGGEDLG